LVRRADIQRHRQVLDVWCGLSPRDMLASDLKYTRQIVDIPASETQRRLPEYGTVIWLTTAGRDRLSTGRHASSVPGLCGLHSSETWKSSCEEKGEALFAPHGAGQCGRREGHETPEEGQQGEDLSPSSREPK
jgi:hypothetical protein